MRVRVWGTFCSNANINERSLSCDHSGNWFLRKQKSYFLWVRERERERERERMDYCAPSFVAVGLLSFSDSSCSWTHMHDTLISQSFISRQEVVNRKYSNWSPPTLPASSPFVSSWLPDSPIPLPSHPVRHPSPFFIQWFILFHEIHVFLYIWSAKNI